MDNLILISAWITAILFIIVSLFIIAIFISNEDTEFAIMRTLAFSCILFLSIFATGRYINKQAQIKVLTGKADYHLVANPDSTKTWEAIK